MPSVLVDTACPIPISTPNSTSLVMDSSGASGADKKRNKLGYSRTSVACVHCRRRKIRCLVSADDSEGRCENCIRLRKECQFYPVDQQPPTDRKARPGNTPTSSADPSIASSSPPSAVLGGSIDPNDIYHYQIPSGATPEMAASAFHQPGFSVAPMGAFSASNNAVPHPELVPSQTIDPSATWEHPGMGNPAQMMWTTTTTHGQILAAGGGGGGAPPHLQMLNPAAAATPYPVQLDGNTLWPAPPPPQRAIPSQADIYPHAPQGHPGFVSIVPPELKRGMNSPAISSSQISPLHSPAASQMQVPVNYSAGPPIAFQQQAQQPQQWSNMNTIPIGGDGSYATIYAAHPDQFPMGQHPTTGP